MSTPENNSQENTATYPNLEELTNIDMSPPQKDATSINTMHNILYVEEYGSKTGGGRYTRYCLRKGPATQIQSFATYCSQEIDMLTTLPAEYNDEKLREIEAGMLMKIATNQIIKIFLAADNITMFATYYPDKIGNYFS